MTTELASRDALELADRVRPMLRRAQEIYATIIDGERAMEGLRDAVLLRAWSLGKILSEIKEDVGHGRWLFWLGGHWPDLSERTAQRCMALHKDNAKANPQNFADLSPDSIRKFMFGYVPAKERPQLQGDERLAPQPHPLTFVNNFTKWDRQAEIGLVTRPPVEVMRRDLEPVVKRIVELLGRDYIAGLLG